MARNSSNREPNNEAQAVSTVVVDKLLIWGWWWEYFSVVSPKQPYISHALPGIGQEGGRSAEVDPMTWAEVS